MIKTLLLLIITLFFLINTRVVLAALPGGIPCDPGATDPAQMCDTINDQLCCKLDPNANPKAVKAYYCQYDPVCATFGKIQPPPPIANLLKTDPTGAGAISNFLSRLVALFFSLGAIVAVFMFLWAAIEWMTSGGEKEKVTSARNKIIYTIIGIILLATSFAILNIVGVFTGFTFFAGQK